MEVGHAYYGREKRRRRAAARRKRTAIRQRRTILIALAAALALAVVIFLGVTGHSRQLETQLAERSRLETQLASGATIRVYNEAEKQTQELPLEEYVLRVVAGEMPAGYESEALKAQAVAARTYTVAKMRSRGGRGCDRGENADVCTSSAHCQAYVSPEKMRQNWGEDTEKNLTKLMEAVAGTRGQILTYEGKPIEALYHASSGGRTEDVANVYSESLPYLVGVDSPDEGDMGGNNAKKTFTYAEFVRRMKSAFPKLQLSADEVKTQVSIRSRYDSGRVKSIRVGNLTLSGKEVRGALSLNSAAFTITFGSDSLTFTTRGFGHGVGMSQAGANAMAKKGSDYREILLHYYTGVELTQAF